MLTLALSGWVINLSLLFFFGVCLLLILFIMIQKPQGGGLSAAFGASSGSGQTAFGTKTGDALTVGTIIMFVVWLLLAVAANFMSRPDVQGSAGASKPGESTPADAPKNDEKKPEQPANTPANPAGENTPANPAPGAAPQNVPPVNPPVVPPVTPPNPAPSPAPSDPAAPK